MVSSVTQVGRGGRRVKSMMISAAAAAPRMAVRRALSVDDGA